MRRECRKHAVIKQNQRKVTAAKIILQKKTAKMNQNHPAMMTAVHHVLPATLLLKLLSQRTFVWNFLITKRIRILSFSIQTLIFPIV